MNLPLLAALLMAPPAQLPTAADTTESGRFVEAEGNRLTRAGVPFRAIGFNQPDLFTSLLLRGNEGRAKSFAAIEDAGRSQVRFLRFWASGFWPGEMKLYFEDKQAYWAHMDELFRHAREHGVMLVPSLFWMSNLWSDLCDEPRSKIADSNSKTYQAMQTYATELVSRYKDDPNVLMWELGNEYFLEADLDSSDRPDADGAGAKTLGTRPARTREDSLTTDMLLSFYTSMTTHLHAVDPNHLVTSGDRGPRPTSRSLRENFPKQVWKEDNLEDHIAALCNSQPRPLDVMSIHCYGNMDGGFLPDEKSTLGLKRVGGLSIRGFELMTAYARAATDAGTSLFVGELGQHPPYITEDPQARFACASIDLLEKEGADLIALWAWHFPAHPKYTVTGSTYPALLKRIGEFNHQHAYGDRAQPPAAANPAH
jgi:mannan endo-1,4-beta-mannosidase